MPGLSGRKYRARAFGLRLGAGRGRGRSDEWRRQWRGRDGWGRMLRWRLPLNSTPRSEARPTRNPPHTLSHVQNVGVARERYLYGVKLRITAVYSSSGIELRRNAAHNPNSAPNRLPLTRIHSRCVRVLDSI